MPTVLVVDDDADTCALLGDLLSIAGGRRMRVQLAYDYAAGLVLLRAGPDALVVDYILGPHNGNDLAIEAAALGIPACIITAANRIENPHAPVLFKPFSCPMLYNVVRALLERQELRLPRERQLHSSSVS